MKKPSPASRSKARRFVLQALYQMHMSGTSAVDVYAQFRQSHDMKRVDTEYLQGLLIGIDTHRAELLALIGPKLERKIEELDPIETAALLIGTYELQHKIELPYRIAINEGVELAKQFGATESHKLVNSVLDALARDLREPEYRAKSR
ncbi:MAG: N utilization substance protein B [Candidatus Azotimanducaceae bacterium]|jgi:N utilization substance protein B